MGWILTRETMIALALVGGAFSLAAMYMQMRGKSDAARLKQINRIGYGFMLASMAVLIVMGFAGISG